MIRLLLILIFVILPFFGKSVDILKPIGTIAIVINSKDSKTIHATYDQKFYCVPPIDHLQIINNSESNNQIPSENSNFRCSFPYYSNALYLNKIPYSEFKRKTLEKWGSSKKRFIKLQVLLI